MLHHPFARAVASSFLLLGSLAGALAQSLTIQGVTDRQDIVGSASFRVVTNAGFTYEVTLNGVPKVAGVTNTILVADYYDLLVRRTNLSDNSVTNALVRFIVRATDRGDTERGLIAWVPYPSIPSTAAELAGAHLELFAPDTYPAGLEIPMVAWIRNAQGGAVRANGSLAVSGQPNIGMRRGVGSAVLPGATAGVLNYTGQLAGVSFARQVNVEASTTWMNVGGTIAGTVAWPPNSRIAVTNHLWLTAAATLTIGEGTIVRLGSGINITNGGHIVIAGTENLPVVFTPMTRTQPWGGLFFTVQNARLEGAGVIFTGAGSRQSGFPGHRSEQPLFNVTINNVHIALTNAAMIALAGQLYHSLEVGSPFSSVTLVRTLIQGATTCGEFNGCGLRFFDSAMLDMPYEDPFYCADPDCDHDGFYLNAGTHELRNSLLGWVKDDCVDSGSGGGPTDVTVSNCWVEGAFHEGLAWSGGGRATRTFDTVVINNGQGLECGWSTGTSPLCDARRLLSLGNSVGVRYGDNYSGTTGLGLKSGFLTNNDCIVLHNHRDVWGQVWDNTWNYRVGNMTINNNYLTAPNTNHPNNTVWDPPDHGPRLAAFMTTPPEAPVGIGLALWPHQFVPSTLTNGVPIRLSSFTTNSVSVDFEVATSGGPLAAGTLTFTAGETVKLITLPPPVVQGLDLVRVVISNPVGGEITGTGTAYLAATPPATTMLIPFGSSWKYLDDGSNPGTAWRNPGYNDSGWSNGLAELGYGDGDERTQIRSNRTDNTRIATTYFRKSINVGDAAQFASFSLMLRRDDAGVIYFNGTDVFRSPNLPAGNLAFDYVTGGTAPPDNTVDSTNIINTGSVLSNGVNVIACEIHQQALGSSDVSFDMQLMGVSLPLVYLSNFGSELVISWSDPTMQLESSTSLPGNWMAVPNATSPYVVTPSAAQQFFQLRR